MPPQKEHQDEKLRRMCHQMLETIRTYCHRHNEPAFADVYDGLAPDKKKELVAILSQTCESALQNALRLLHLPDATRTAIAGAINAAPIQTLETLERDSDNVKKSVQWLRVIQGCATARTTYWQRCRFVLQETDPNPVGHAAAVRFDEDIRGTVQKGLKHGVEYIEAVALPVLSTKARMDSEPSSDEEQPPQVHPNRWELLHTEMPDLDTARIEEDWIVKAGDALGAISPSGDEAGEMLKKISLAKQEKNRDRKHRRAEKKAKRKRNDAVLLECNVAWNSLQDRLEASPGTSVGVFIINAMCNEGEQRRDPMLEQFSEDRILLNLFIFKPNDSHQPGLILSSYSTTPNARLEKFFDGSRVLGVDLCPLAIELQHWLRRSQTIEDIIRERPLEDCRFAWSCICSEWCLHPRNQPKNSEDGHSGWPSGFLLRKNPKNKAQNIVMGLLQWFMSQREKNRTRAEDDPAKQTLLTQFLNHGITFPNAPPMEAEGYKAMMELHDGARGINPQSFGATSISDTNPKKGRSINLTAIARYPGIMWLLPPVTSLATLFLGGATSPEQAAAPIPVTIYSSTFGCDSLSNGINALQRSV